MIDRRIKNKVGRSSKDYRWYLQRGKRLITVLKDVGWKSKYQMKELKRVKKKMVKSENFGEQYYRSLFHDLVVMSYNINTCLDVLENLRGEDWDVRDEGKNWGCCK